MPKPCTTTLLVLLFAAGPAGAADAERGRRLLAQYPCGTCHHIPGVEGARGGLAPSLDRYGWRSYIAGAVPNGAPNLTRWIVAPQALIPNAAMPRVGASPSDAHDMAAYLLALR